MTLLHVHLVGNPNEISSYLPDSLHKDQCLVILQRSFNNDNLAGISRGLGRVISSTFKVGDIICEPNSQKAALEFQKGAGLNMSTRQISAVNSLEVIRSLCHGQAVLITCQEGQHLEETITSMTGRNSSPHIIKAGNVCLLLFGRRVRIISERYLDFLLASR